MQDVKIKPGWDGVSKALDANKPFDLKMNGSKQTQYEKYNQYLSN